MDGIPAAPLPKGARYEASEDVGRNRSMAPTLGDVFAARMKRRDVVKGALAVSAVSAVMGPAMLVPGSARAADSSFDFEEIEAGVDDTHHVAPGYRAEILIRWGDPVVQGAPAFDPMAQTAAAQEMQFGYNCDYVGYLPLPAGSDASDHGVLVINHEYTSEELMFSGLGVQDVQEVNFAGMTKELVDIELAAHGLSVIEVQRGADGAWGVVAGSSLDRRLSMLSGAMTVSGPAAGHDRLKTTVDPTGREVIGTLNNCAGGLTPWGTALTGEENIQGYFSGTLPEGHRESANHARYGVPGNFYAWGRFHDRFDLGKEPNEPNRFGWIVEIDPYDPAAKPIKRTALGRLKHEGANTIVNGDGRVVAYMGDDERFEYVYKYVSTGTVDTADRAANASLLDDGTLYVARFDEGGGLDWLALVHGQGPLVAENGFASQADVLIEARRAADLLGATPMDRPEDVDVNPVTGRVYVMLTNNTRRTPEQVDPANPRPENAFGHIVELIAADGDHAALTAGWEILVQCGDPAAGNATWNPATTANGWFGSPDNCAIDPRGRLWVTTDGNGFKYSGRTDGVWAMETDGELRGTGKHFFRVPVGAEMCGPVFTPDGQTLFLAVQHPGEGGSDWPGFGRSSTFDDPATRWPDFAEGMPPRPSIVVVTREGGGPIG